MDKDTFRNPPMKYRAAPFWSWNGKLDVEETRWQVRELTKGGMGGGFMHSRAGLSTEYLGEDWFANCAASIEEGRKVGFYSWLYDEDRWPSGSCGGRTAASHPDFRSRILIMQRGNEPIERADNFPRTLRSCADLQCLGRFRVVAKPNDETKYIAVDENDAMVDTIAFHSAVLPAMGWDNDGYYADLMNRDAMQEFLRNTYDPYAERFQESFGKEVPGIFTDEPLVRGPLPWSVCLCDEFRKRRGYDLIPKLPHLFFTSSESPAVRHDYWQTVRELFRENYIAQLGDWCDARGLALTGHLMSEHGIGKQICYSGGTMVHYDHMQIPGIDLLCERIVEVDTVKQCSSVCNQLGKRVMMSELYGCTGYLFSLEGQKWVGDWQMALGVNFLCPHLTYYTMKGMAKRDYPPSYFYQSPWWRHYHHIADYQARLSYVLREGKAMRDVLLIHPLTGGWCKYDPAADAESDYGLNKQSAAFHDTMQHLLSLHHDFDLGDETIMAEKAAVHGREMIVGKARYKLVIVAPTCNLESSTVRLLEQYVEAGGRLLWLTETPTFMDGRPSNRLAKVIQASGVCRAAPHRRDLEETLDRVIHRRLSVRLAETNHEASKVLAQVRETDGAYVIFLANTDREMGATLKVRLDKSGAWARWDCETGQVEELPSKGKETGSEVEVALAPVGSTVLRLDPNKEPVLLAAPRKVRVREKAIDPPQGWKFRRLAPNSIVLDRCRYRINHEAFSDEMLMPDAQEEWRARFTLRPWKGLAGDTQVWKQKQDPESSRSLARLGLQYTFKVDKMPSEEVFLVLEDRATFEIHVNDKLVEAPAEGWFMDKSFEKVPVRAFLKRGANTVELRTILTPLTMVEDIYVVGEFGVGRDTFAITREPRRLHVGDWCDQGYPTYADAMMYQTTFRAGEKFSGRVIVELDRFEGTAAAIWVNGQKAAVLGWRPYRADVTDFVRKGSNDLGIEIVGSPRNLMGPRHTAERYTASVGPHDMVDTSFPGHHLSPGGLYGDVRLLYVKEGTKQ